MIIYFSGTGNTRYCARMLADALGDKLMELTGGMLLAPSRARIVTDDQRIIWMFPVYSWGIPPVVDDILKRARIGTPRTAVHHLVMTCGDDVGLTHKQWREIMKRRHLTSGLTFSVRMPNTYVLMKGFNTDESDVEKEKINEAPKRIEHIAKQIINFNIPDGKPVNRLYNEKSMHIDDVETGKWPFIKSAVIRPWFEKFCMSPKPFHSNDSCTKCGHCAQICPLGNIILDAHRRPMWGDKCALCLRCYHACPTKSIGYGHATHNKRQYKRFLGINK